MGGFFKDGDGNQSSTRLGFLLTLMVVLSVWGCVCISKYDMVDIPSGVIGLIVTLALAKVVQSHIETNPVNTSP